MKVIKTSSKGSMNATEKTFVHHFERTFSESIDYYLRYFYIHKCSLILFRVKLKLAVCEMCCSNKLGLILS